MLLNRRWNPKSSPTNEGLERREPDGAAARVGRYVLARWLTSQAIFEEGDDLDATKVQDNGGGGGDASGERDEEAAGSEVSMRHVVRKCAIPSPWRSMASAHAHWHLGAVCTGRIIGDPEPVCRRRAFASPGWNQLAFLEAKITKRQLQANKLSSPRDRPLSTT